MSAYETWFADMSWEGLLVTEVAADKVRFTRAEPQVLQYRMLDCPKGDQEQKIRRCVKKGWKLVCVYTSAWQRNTSVFLIFSAPREIPPLKMDAQERNLISRRIRSTIWNRIILLLFMTFLTVNYVVSESGVLNVYRILWYGCLGGILLVLLLQLLNVFSCLRRWKNPQIGPLSSDWRRQRRQGRFFFTALLVLWLLLLVTFLTASYRDRATQAAISDAFARPVDIAAVTVSTAPFPILGYSTVETERQA